MSLEIHPEHASHPAHHHDIDLHVRYIAARHPFIDARAPTHETLVQVKPRVLAFFKLKEGPVNGGTKTYEFAHHGVVVTDLAITLGTLAEGHHELKLDLLERFEQG
jgi:hypothetical protein